MGRGTRQGACDRASADNWRRSVSERQGRLDPRFGCSPAAILVNLKCGSAHLLLERAPIEARQINLYWIIEAALKAFSRSPFLDAPRARSAAQAPRNCGRPASDHPGGRRGRSTRAVLRLLSADTARLRLGSGQSIAARSTRRTRLRPYRRLREFAAPLAPDSG